MSWFSRKTPAEEIKELTEFLDAKLNKDSKQSEYEAYSETEGLSSNIREMVKDAIETQKIKRLIPKYRKLKRLIEENKNVISSLDNELRKKALSIVAGMEIFIQTLK